MSGGQNQRAETFLKLLPKLVIQTIEQTNEAPRCAIEIALEFNKGFLKEPFDINTPTKLILTFNTLIPMLEQRSYPKRLIVLRKAAFHALMHAKIPLSSQSPLINEHVA